MLGKGGIGLVLIDPGGCVVCAGDVGGPAERHEISATALDIQRIICFQGDVNGALATFGDQVKAVIEKLTKDGHPAGVRW